MTTRNDRRVKLTYRCRDIGYGVEEGEVVGRWTGEVDAWGKHTFEPDRGETLYLFEDEIVEESAAPKMQRQERRQSEWDRTRQIVDVTLAAVKLEARRVGADPVWLEGLWLSAFRAGFARGAQTAMGEPTAHRQVEKVGEARAWAYERTGGTQ